MMRAPFLFLLVSLLATSSACNGQTADLDPILRVAQELALGKDKDPSGKAKDFAGEYMITDLTRTYQSDQSEIAFHEGHGTSLEGPDSGKSSISIFVF